MINYTSLELFKNIHKGKCAIICGAAPSLNNIEFNKITKENIIFACNQSVTVMTYCDYFCMTDAAIPETSDLFKYGSNITKNIMALGALLQISCLPFYEEIKDKTYFIERRTNNDINFNNNQSLILGVDVTHPTAHLAYIMGCNPIILAGIDLQPKLNKMYCDNKFYDKEISWGNRPYDFNNSYMQWVKIKENNSNIKFLNTSLDGKLKNLFETILIEELYK